MNQTKQFILALSCLLLSADVSSLAKSDSYEIEIEPSLNNQDVRHRTMKRGGKAGKPPGNGGGKPKCTPSSMKGIWSHMSQGVSSALYHYQISILPCDVIIHYSTGLEENEMDCICNNCLLCDFAIL